MELKIRTLAAQLYIKIAPSIITIDDDNILTIKPPKVGRDKKTIMAIIAGITATDRIITMSPDTTYIFSAHHEANEIIKVTQVANHKEDVWLVYDGECPVCKTYCKYIRICEAVGDLHLVDARQPGELMDEIARLGLEIDQGMVLKFKNVIYYGSDAIHMLTLLSTPSGIFNRINYYLFSTKPGAHIAYPIGKAFRTLILKLLGIRHIGNLKKYSPTSSV